MNTVKVYGYLRVSTGKQELENNKGAILLKAQSLNLGIDVEWIEEQISGTVLWSHRELGKLMNIIQPNDVIITSEVSRFGRKYLDIMSFLAKCAEKKIRVYCTSSDLSVDGTLQSQILTFAQSISAQIEREMISTRTKTALQRKKAEGVKLGRKNNVMILDFNDQNKNDIKKLIDDGVKLKVIADKFKTSGPTLRKFIKKYDLKTKKK